MPETGTTLMQYDAAYSLMIQELENKLPVYITYHNASHTRSVVEAPILLSESEGVSEEEKTIIKTAALFHDAGFLKSNKNHEDGSCAVARRHLPDFGYSGEQIEAVCKCILATRLPQKPAS